MELPSQNYQKKVGTCFCDSKRRVELHFPQDLLSLFIFLRTHCHTTHSATQRLCQYPIFLLPRQKKTKKYKPLALLFWKQINHSSQISFFPLCGSLLRQACLAKTQCVIHQLDHWDNIVSCNCVCVIRKLYLGRREKMCVARFCFLTAATGGR